MAAQLTRIFSDLHYGDRSSRIVQLAQLRPLLDGADALIVNGDVMDTRAGPDPVHSDATRREVTAFFASLDLPVQFLTGNHDPDITPAHALDLASGQVWVIHGDIVFDEIVPWGRDAAWIRERVQAARERLGPAGQPASLADELALFRGVAAAVPQRHQSERNRWKYLARFAADTVWPPWRMGRVWRAWQVYPERIRTLTKRYRPAARFTLVGHTHRPGIWREDGAPTVINTGSFCRPFTGQMVDLTPNELTVRRIALRHGEFHPGAVIARFPLNP